MMQFVLNFYGKWGLLDVVKSENNGICVVLTRDQFPLVTCEDYTNVALYSLLLNNHQGKNFHWSFKKIREMAMTR